MLFDSLVQGEWRGKGIGDRDGDRDRERTNRYVCPRREDEWSSPAQDGVLADGDAVQKDADGHGGNGRPPKGEATSIAGFGFRVTGLHFHD